MKNPYFGRLLTAMVTPFNADGSVNYEKAADLAEWLINNGSDGLVVAGSTGEAATMNAEEKLELFRVVVNRINKRVPVIAGTGSNNTADSVKMTKMAEAMGVDGALIVGPYYNKPTQEGLYRHFKTIAEAVDIPVIITVTREDTDIEARLRAGASILNVAAGPRTPDVVRLIREKNPQVPIIASGGKTGESIRQTIAAGANAITFTPPSTQELFKEMMERYRE